MRYIYQLILVTVTAGGLFTLTGCASDQPASSTTTTTTEETTVQPVAH